VSFETRSLRGWREKQPVLQLDCTQRETCADRKAPSNLTRRIFSSLSNPWTVVVAASVFCFLLGAYRLGRQGLWFDELVSLYLSTTDWGSFWRIVSAKEANMVLYYVLLRPWLHFGTSEFAIRAMSLVLSVAAIPMVFLLGRRLFGVRTGVIASLLLAASAFNIKYAQEARSYSLVLLLVLAAGFLFVRAMGDPSVRNWAWYCLTASAAFYAHFFSLLVIVAHFCSILWVPNRRSLPWKRYIAAGLVFAALTSPLLVFIKTRNAGQLSWVQKPTMNSAYVAFETLTGFGGEYLVGMYLALLGLAGWCGVRTYHRSRQDGWKWLFLGLWFALPIACLLTFSLVRRPVFVDRYLMICLPPLILLTAAIISNWRRRAVQAAVLGVLLALSGYGVYNYYQQRKHDWGGATTYVAAHASSRDGVILFSPMGWLGLHYYWPRVSQTRMPFASMFPRTFDYSRLISGDPIFPDEKWVKNSSENCERMWLILNVEDPTIASELRRTVNSYYPSVRSQNEFYGIKVILYENKSGSAGAIHEGTDSDVLVFNCGGLAFGTATGHGC
jgi:mannosyltransferase